MRCNPVYGEPRSDRWEKAKLIAISPDLCGLGVLQNFSELPNDTVGR
jgi:hypothetical protein